MREVDPFATTSLVDIDHVLLWDGPSCQAQPIPDILDAIEATDILLQTRPKPANMSINVWLEQISRWRRLLAEACICAKITADDAPPEPTTASFSSLAHSAAQRVQRKLDSELDQGNISLATYAERQLQLLSTLYDVCSAFDLATWETQWNSLEPTTD